MLIQGVKGAAAPSFLQTTNHTVSKAFANRKGAWKSAYIRFDPSFCFLLCYNTEASITASEMISLEGSTISLIGRRKVDPRLLMSWKIVDKYKRVYLLSCPHGGITRMWTDILKNATMSKFNADANHAFAIPGPNRENMDSSFSNVRSPILDKESIRLESLILAAAEGHLEEVKSLLEDSPDKSRPGYESKKERWRREKEREARAIEEKNKQSKIEDIERQRLQSLYNSSLRRKSLSREEGSNALSASLYNEDPTNVLDKAPPTSIPVAVLGTKTALLSGRMIESKIQIWEEEVHVVESLRVDSVSIKNILKEVNMAVGQDVLRGKIIGVGLSSLKERSAQIIQAFFRGSVTRLRFLRRRKFGKKKLFVTKVVHKKHTVRMKKYFENHPNELIAQRRKKYWSSQLEPPDPASLYSDHLQRLIAFAPHRSNKMAQKIQNIVRGWSRRRIFLSLLDDIKNAVACIQGWYRTMIGRFWRRRHERATIIEKYERRRQAYVQLAALRKETLEFVQCDIIRHYLIPNMQWLMDLRKAMNFMKMIVWKIRFKKMRRSTTVLSSWWRCCAKKYEYRRLKYFIIRFQAQVRFIPIRRAFKIHFKRIRWAALAIQGWWRAGTLPYVFQRKRTAVSRLAAWSRCQTKRLSFRRLRAVITTLQAHFRMHQAANYFKDQQGAVTAIANAVRRRQAKLKYEKQRSAAAAITRISRIILAKKALRYRKLYLKTVIRCQCWGRRSNAMRHYLGIYRKIKQIQKWLRIIVSRYCAKQKMTLLSNAATRIQTMYRRYMCLWKKWRNNEAARQEVFNWHTGDALFEEYLVVRDGKRIMVRVEGLDTGLKIKAVDLSNGHRKSWDMSFKLSWYSLTVYTALHPELNHVAFKGESYLKALISTMVDKVPKNKRFRLTPYLYRSMSLLRDKHRKEVVALENKLLFVQKFVGKYVTDLIRLHERGVDEVRELMGQLESNQSHTHKHAEDLVLLHQKHILEVMKVRDVVVQNTLHSSLISIFLNLHATHEAEMRKLEESYAYMLLPSEDFESSSSSDDDSMAEKGPKVQHDDLVGLQRKHLLQLCNLRANLMPVHNFTLSHTQSMIALKLDHQKQVAATSPSIKNISMPSENHDNFRFLYKHPKNKLPCRVPQHMHRLLDHAFDQFFAPLFFDVKERKRVEPHFSPIRIDLLQYETNLLSIKRMFLCTSISFLSEIYDNVGQNECGKPINKLLSVLSTPGKWEQVEKYMASLRNRLMRSTKFQRSASVSISMSAPKPFSFTMDRINQNIWSKYLQSIDPRTFNASVLMHLSGGGKDPCQGDQTETEFVPRAQQYHKWRILLDFVKLCYGSFDCSLHKESTPEKNAMSHDDMGNEKINQADSLKKLLIRIYSARFLKDTHENLTGRTNNPYVKVYYNDKFVYQTNVAQKTRNPVWDQHFKIHAPNLINVQHDALRFEVCDYVAIGPHALLGEVIFSGSTLIDLISRKSNLEQYELIKKPVATESDASKQMKGRVSGQLSINVCILQTPVNKIKPTWFYAFIPRGHVTVNQSLPNISISSIALTRYLMSCRRGTIMDWSVPILAEALEILKYDWLPSFCRSEFFICEGDVDGNDLQVEPPGFAKTVAENIRSFTLFQLQGIPEIDTNPSLSPCTLEFMPMSMVFVPDDITAIAVESKRHLDRSLSFAKHCLSQIFQRGGMMKVPGQNADHLEQSKHLLIQFRKFSQLLQINNALIVACDLHESKCDEVIYQSNKQQEEQKLNKETWRKRKEESSVKLKNAKSNLKMKERIIIGIQDRPDPADKAMIATNLELLRLRTKEKELTASLLELIKSSVLDMKNDIKISKATKLRLQGIRTGHQEWQHLLSLFEQALGAKQDRIAAKCEDLNCDIVRLNSEICRMRREQFSYQMVRQLENVDLIEIQIKERELCIEQSIQQQQILARSAIKNIENTAAFTARSLISYTEWAKDMIDSFHEESVLFSKAILVMNNTNHFLSLEESKCLNQIAVYMKCVEERLSEQKKTMSKSESYWWHKYSTDKDMKNAWYREQRKARRRKELAEELSEKMFREELELRHKQREEKKREITKEITDIALLVEQTNKDRNELREKQRDLRWLERYGESHKEKIESNLENIKRRQKQLKEDRSFFDSMSPLPPVISADESTVNAVVENEWKGGDAFVSDSDAEDEVGKESVEKGSEREIDDEATVDSHDLVEGDFADLSYEMVFLPLWKRRKLLEEQNGVDEEVKEMRIKNWTISRRKEIRRLVRRRSVEQAYEEVHMCLQTTHNNATEVEVHLHTAAPTFLSTFEGAAVHAAFCRLQKAVAHAEWKDLPLAIRDCRSILGKIEHVVKFLRGATNRHAGIDEPLVLQIEDIGGCVLECLWKLEGIEELVTRKEINFVQKNEYGVPNRLRKQFSPKHFEMYRLAYASHMTKTKEGEERLNSVNLRKAMEDCGRTPVALEVADLQLLRLYKKQHINFTEFLDYVRRPLEGPLTVKYRYVSAVAGHIRQQIDTSAGAVTWKVDQIVDGISPQRKRARKVFKSAVKIQAYYRGKSVRRAFLASRYYFTQGIATHSAAMIIQNLFWRTRGTKAIEKYIKTEIDKVFDPSTMHCFFVQRSTLHSFVHLPSILPKAFVNNIDFSTHRRYTERAVLDAIKPDELVKQRSEILHMRAEINRKYATAVEKAHATASKQFAMIGEYILPSILEPKELRFLIETLNDLNECKMLVRSFAIPSNGLKTAWKKFMDVRPEEFDQNNSDTSILL